MQKKISNLLRPDLLASIRDLHFATRFLADQGLAGQYRSAFRGRGVEFEEVREYSPGDDIRTIDWKVTARSRKPYVKVFHEERELTVMVAVDISASTLGGTRGVLRENLVAKIGALLTLIALRNNDKVGLTTFSSEIISYHPPKKGRGAVWRMLHEVLAPKTNVEIRSQKTDFGNLFKFLSRVMKKRAVVFIISDFIGADYEKDLAILAKRHDLTAVQIIDPIDLELPNVGLISLRDSETGATRILDTSDPKTLEIYQRLGKERVSNLERLFRKVKVGHLTLRTDQPFINKLRAYFSQKTTRQELVKH